VSQMCRRLHRTATLLALVAVYLPVPSSLLARVHPDTFLRHAAIGRQGISPSAKPQGYSLRWVPGSGDGRTARVEVSGLSLGALKALQNPRWSLADWKRVLAIYTEQGNSRDASDLPPMLGTYRVHSGLVNFEPQFPLDPGRAYRAEFRPDQLPGSQSTKDARLVAVFKLPAMRQGLRTVVQQVFPSSLTLPENLLKFYVHFSAPMSRGRIYEHIHLRNDAGKEIELPFLEIDEELWNPTMTRLTLFIDPGRIKRGVLPLEEIGPALETGKNYSLVIDSDWKDGAGEPLQAGFEKRFGVAAPDRDPPDPASWKIQAVPSGTREPLRVTFPEPMDHALAQRVIQVVTDSGREFSGEVTLEDQERRWVFVPANPWRSGTYQLLVPTTIEDLAGNNIGKPFEVDLFEAVQRRLATPTVKLPFEVR
jgi:hypothetical protein